ncbi:uncharacterized mitochondrial protein AtMg00810-like [Helianthus annuus]|uniref:uncharacterized mitochondrial protein AtMg00810-like n=1 Tax=Helianthus annuus TaxID=4232 RepID=UPI000B8EFEF8|nr:uncharacterized mitochondrial protein AtMg00810-like [Helianthus annuus]
MASFITHHNNEFAIKDLGDLNYFLGFEVTRTTNGLFLCQSKYADDILARVDLLDAKPVHTPLTANESFTLTGDHYHDPTTYRSLALQYLTITRPDVSYDHVKRILCYIKRTCAYGLTLTKLVCTTILGFSDVDWARCIDTRRSTYGYSIFWGGNLVSWSPKKQPNVARASCESEYRAMANTAAEII